MKNFLVAVVLLLCIKLGYSQSNYYSIIQAGGNIGLNNPGYDGKFNGYSLHFIFGKNLNEKAYVGIGLGNETLKGSYTQTNSPNDDNKTAKYDRNLFPVFLDARLPLAYIGEVSRIGVFANAGYAAKIGPVYDKGAIGKLGVFYLYDSFNKTKFTFSASYVYQQLKGNLYGSDFKHQHLNLSVGIMLK